MQRKLIEEIVIENAEGLFSLTCVSKIKASRLLSVFSRSRLARSLSVRSCSLKTQEVLKKATKLRAT